MAKLYSCGAVEGLLQNVAEHEYEVLTVQEGVLGYGHMLLIAPHEGWDNVEVEEVALNEWSSGHKIRTFRKISKRIAALIEIARNGYEDNED